MRFDQVSATRRSIRATDDDVSVHRPLSILESHVADEREHLIQR
jgi:hypothetical protein